MLKATLLLSLAAAASAKAHGHCNMCPSGKTMVTSPKTVKTKACLADDRLVESECYACMKKAFSRTYPVYPECLNCNYTNGTEAFCPEIMGDDPTCGTNTGSFLCDAKVTERANCPKKTDKEAYSWCAEVMGEATCSDPNPTNSFQCDEGSPVASSSSSWAKCPRKKETQLLDPECSGCLDQYRPSYTRKVDSCYRCFKNSDGSKAWCPDIMGEGETCDTNTSSFVCDDAGTKVTTLASCPTNMDEKYNTTGVPGFVPEAKYGYCADVMGEPWCQKNPTASFQCDEGEPIFDNSLYCPAIKSVQLWAPATLVKTKDDCDKGPSLMEDVTCDQIQKEIDSWKGTDCKKTELFERFGAKCCVNTAPSPAPKKNVTGTGGVANTVSHTVLAAAGFVAFLV
jgi:hypothetical protein